jgi:hypothetical protein
MTSLIKLDKQTIDLLNNFSKINTMLHINPGNEVATFQGTGSRSVFYGRTTVPCEFPVTITIYDLNEFLRVVSSFSEDEAHLECHETYMVIRDESGSKKIKFSYGNPKMINKQIVEGKNIELNDLYETIAVSDRDFQFVIKQARSLALCELMFVSDGETISITASDTAKKKEDIVVLKTDNVPSTDKPWRFGFSIENVTRLMRGDYDVGFKVLSGNQVVGQFLHKNIALKYVLGAQNDTCRVG